MIDLHDSHGRHIANFVSGQLHDVPVSYTHLRAHET